MCLSIAVDRPSDRPQGPRLRAIAVTAGSRSLLLGEIMIDFILLAIALLLVVVLLIARADAMELIDLRERDIHQPETVLSERPDIRSSFPAQDFSTARERLRRL